MSPAVSRPDFSQETLLWSSAPGGVLVFGIDEAGRGCLAGPVCAAVACWSPRGAPPFEVRDSKQMSEPQREACFPLISSGTCAHGAGFASAQEIDRWNILRANHLAVARALELALRSLQLDAERIRSSRQEFAFLSDGNRPLLEGARFFFAEPDLLPEFSRVRALFARGFRETPIVKGDTKVFSIASASVLAKVSRDRVMRQLHELYPQYEFAVHKGYSTARHIELLDRHGPCTEHRRSFAPVSGHQLRLPLA